MVRLLLFFLPLLLYGVSLQERVANIIGQQKFMQNRLLVNTIFSHDERFYKNGSIDMLKVVKTLQRLGLISQKYDKPRQEQIEFITYIQSPLFFKLVFDVLQEATVVDYVIEKMEQDHDGAFVRVVYKSNLVADPVKIMKFFHKNGIKVLTLSHSNGVWRYIIDFSKAFLAVPELKKKLYFTNIRYPIWIVVNGQKKIVVRALNSTHWHPKLYIFNENFEPVEVIRKRKHLRQIILRLPKGRYYIKIADTFVLNNIQSGIEVFAQ